MKHKVIYPVVFIIISISSFFFILFFSSPNIRLIIPGYGVFVYGFILFRHVYVLIKISKIAKKATPVLYKKHLGYSSWGSLRIVKPSYVYSKQVGMIENKSLARMASELKYLYVFLFLSFFALAALAITSAI